MLRDAHPECAPRPATSPRAQALFERITAARPAAPGRSWSARRAIRRPLQPLWPEVRWRPLPIAVAAAAAAALIVTGTLIGLGGSGAGPGRRAPAGPGRKLGGPARQDEQLGGPGERRRHQDQRGAQRRYDTTIWRLGEHPPGARGPRPRRRTCYDIGETATQITVVDYLTRTWWVRPVPRGKVESPVFSGCSLTGFAPLPTPLPAGRSLAWTGAWIRQFIGQGHYRVDGRTVIDGQQALILTALTTSDVSAREWVSASTDLPPRASFSIQSRHISQICSISCLPPATTNLAQLTIAIPAGFTHRHP